MNNIFKKPINIPGFKKVEDVINKFGIGEKAMFFVLSAILTTSSLILFSKANDEFSITVPAKGGMLTEGILGSLRFINPLLAVSDADRDLSSLIFSGLLKPNSNGDLIPEIAEKYEVSEDGLTYTVTIKEKAYFHDEEPITTDDIIFTIEKAKDPSIKSPRRAEWEGVDVQKINDRVVVFKLARPYYPFIENLTLGIIPKHLWKDVGPEEFAFSLKNITPVGSGPFKIKKMDKNDKGIPTTYELEAFDKYAGGAPYIETFLIKLFSSEKELIDAWKRGKIESMGGISPNEISNLGEKNIRAERLKLPRVYGLFFNQNQATVFIDKTVRQALLKVTDKNAIVEKVLSGYGTVLEGPLLSDAVEKDNSAINPVTSTSTSIVAEAVNILKKSGWVLNKNTNIFEKTEKTAAKNSKSPSVPKSLSFSISAPNVPELKEVANILKESFSSMGASVDIKLFELSDLNQNVIRPRKYDALLFGQVIGRNPDLFAFWHSSQRNDPGYNIALYANSKVDKLLDEARQTKNQKEQEVVLDKIFTEITSDMPAIFLYTPDYIYIVPEKLKGFETMVIASPGERFANVKNWFIENDKVWTILAPKK